jgi:hypothetical protein
MGPKIRPMLQVMTGFRNSTFCILAFYFWPMAAFLCALTPLCALNSWVSSVSPRLCGEPFWPLASNTYCASISPGRQVLLNQGSSGP